MEFYKCNCGAQIDLSQLLRTAEENALFDGDYVDLEEEVECEVCGSVFKVEVEASVTVYSNLNSIECIHESCPEINGINIFTLTIGEKVDLEDGLYRVGPNEYKVEHGVLVAIFNSITDENQFQLAI